MQISDVPQVLQRIELCIAESKMSKQEFYQRSGISSGSFSQWNTGTHKPTLKKLQDAADALGVSLGYLLYGEDSSDLEAPAFWDNFLFYCKQIGEAPNTVAAKVGVKSSGTVTGWKNGAAPRNSVLAKLAQYFGVSVSELTEDNKKAAPEAGDGELDTSGLSADAIDFAKRVAELSPEKRALLDAYIRALKDI